MMLTRAAGSRAGLAPKIGWMTANAWSRISRNNCLFPLHQHFSTSEEPSGRADETAKDYFHLLGVSRGFSVDLKELNDSYRRLMAANHPDVQQHQQKKEGDEVVAVADASEITNAYHTLRKPHSRAVHLLGLLGKPIDETSGASKLVKPAFLMEMMELREDIDSIPSIDESGGDEETVKQLESHISDARSKIERLLKGMESAYKSDDFDKAWELAAQLQYWNRIEETVLEKM